jgi:hypothetical protein
MVNFQTQNPNLGKFWKVLQWMMLVFLLTIWSILQSNSMFMAIWYILWSFGVFGMLHREKSGNPGA